MIKTYTFSRSKDLEDLEILSKLKAEKENDYRISLKIDHDDEEEADDDRIIISNRYIKDTKESAATPLKKLTDLIASTAYDYNPGSNETQFILANISRRFRDNSNAKTIVNTILIFAETETKAGMKRTVRQWYDTIMAVTDRMENENAEKSQLKSKVKSLEYQVRELTQKLERANALDAHRIQEIDKWRHSYEQAQAEISVWKSRFEEMRDAERKAQYEHKEVLRQKYENAMQQETIGRLQHQLDKDSMIVATAKKYIGDSPLTPDVILNKFANDEEFKKRERAFENKIKDLQEKLGKKTVPLTVLAKGLMDYAEEAGISEAHELFNHLNNMLISEPEWTNNVPELKKFFKKARKEMETRQITMTGEHATYNENINK